MQKHNFTAVQSSVENTQIEGVEVLRVIKSAQVEAFDEPTYARIQDTLFENGTIEVKVLSRLLPTAPDFARGFIGIAFHIDATDTSYESIYIRPTNGRSEDQFRRNHTTQYYAYPDYKFDRLRVDAPGVYESYVDTDMDTWIQLKITVQGNKAQLFVQNAEQPALIVNDLKLGGRSGAIALWVDIGTEGFFKDLIITPNL